LSEQFAITNHLLHPARQLVSPNQSEREPAADISLLVIHNISLPPGKFGGGYVDDLFCNCLDSSVDPFFAEIAELRVSAHLLIERDGRVTQYVPFDCKAWHAGQSCFQGRESCNDFSVGIELEGSDDTRFTDAQYAALVAITRVLMEQYPAIRGDRIVGHSDIAPGRKTDPGPLFDWQRYRGQIDSDQSVNEAGTLLRNSTEGEAS
jgi:AmpD protein